MNTATSTFLQDLSSEVQYELKHKLNRGNAWKLVADYCNIRDEYGLIEASKNAGETLFCELCAQNYTVAEVCEALAKCDLLEVLALFQEPAPLQTEAKPLILCEVKSLNGAHNEIFIEEGEELKLKAQAEGIPPPKYEWHCDNAFICSNLSGLLTIEKFEKKNEGRYWCKISQQQEKSQISKITEDITVTLAKTVNKDRPKVSAKKALLIANQSYDFDELQAPASDTAQLHDVLKEIYNFDVTVKKDLTGVEMRNVVREFWKDVPANSYVIFYFAGHGFRISNDLFFMGIDKVEPKDFGFQHAMSHEEVIQEGSEHKPSLLLMLCDTCQSQLQDDKYVAINTQAPPKYDYLPYPDVIQGYATSRNGEAFEVDDERKGGLFTEHLIKVLKSQTHLSVSEILANVRKGVHEDKVNKYGDETLQVPMEITSAIRTHHLSDPISKRKKNKKKVDRTKEPPK